jgi:hypothetical protein
MFLYTGIESCLNRLHQNLDKNIEKLTLFAEYINNFKEKFDTMRILDALDKVRAGISDQ